MTKYLLSFLLVFSAFSVAEAGVGHWNDSNFNESVSQGVVVVDFWAKWCGPCVKFGPTFEKVAADVGGSANFGKVNIDEARNVARQYNVRSIPTVIILKDGKEIKRKTGGMSEQAFRSFVKSAL